MTGFADTLRGDGLARAHRALAGLEGDLQRLDRARVRFEVSPPPYSSNRSGTTTRSASPDPPSEEQRRRQERRIQLGLEHRASEPYTQFEHQTSEEKKRIIAADRNGTHCVEQGIWNNKWNKFASGRWKHEEPLDVESESETDSEVESSSFSFFPKQSQPKPRRPKSDEEKRRIAERRVVREREREASRPYHQFIYQISKERGRIQDEYTNGEGLGIGLPDINATAYDNVKNTWTKRGIWNRRWGILPGMSWKHEEPFEEEAVDDPAPIQAKPLMNGSVEAGKVPATFTFGSHSPVELNHRQMSGALNSQRGSPGDINLVGVENGDAKRSSSTSNSSPKSGKRIIRPTMEQTLLRSKRKASRKDGQPANAYLGPVHASKVSKAAGKRKGPQQQLNIAQKVSSDSLPLSSSVEITEPQLLPLPGYAAPRRSKRIQQLVPNVSKNLKRISSANLSIPTVRSKPEQNIANNLTARSSVKPQGISKKQSTKTTQGRARKKLIIDAQSGLCI